MRRIVTTLDGERHERVLATRDEYRRTLYEDFGVVRSERGVGPDETGGPRS